MVKNEGVLKTTFDNTQNIADIVRYHSRVNQDTAAIIIDDKKITYRLLDINSNKLANALLGLNIKPKDRIVYYGMDSEVYYELLFACAKANFVLVPINWRLKTDEVKYIIENSKAVVVFFDQQCSKMVEEFRKLITTLHFYIAIDGISSAQNYPAFIKNQSVIDPWIDINCQESLVQIYTSGTTGHPKGVELTHEVFFKIRHSLRDNHLNWLDWHSDDINFVGLPGFHIGGLWWAIQGFYSGIPNVIVPTFTPTATLMLFAEHKVSITCLVPSMISMVLQEYQQGDASYDLSALRKIVYGGSPAPEGTISAAKDAFQCELVQIYGLTETGNTAVCLPADEHEYRSTSAMPTGRPYPCVKLKIVDETGNCLPAFNIGEILIHTPARMKGYWQLPSATKQVLVNEWIYTGDAGYLDEDGYLYVCDRLKDMIIVAGEKVYPAEVENVINKHPQVLESAVLGFDDDMWGESVQAFIVLKEKTQILKLRDLIAFLRTHIADYKIPKKFRFLDEIPRTSSGKILKRVLKNI